MGRASYCRKVQYKNGWSPPPTAGESRSVLRMTSKRSDISVLIASPRAISCELLVGALRQHKQFRVVNGGTTSKEVLEAVRSVHVDVVLIHPTLADGPTSGFAALRQIQEIAPEVRSIILLDANERNLVVDAFRVGARGVFSVSKSNFKTLCRCVEQVHAGQIWANRSELSEVIEAFYQLAPVRVVNADGLRLLTTREEDVVRLLSEGMQNRDIARKLKLSEHTVKNYLFHVFDKLGISSRVELALYAATCSNGSRLPVSRGTNRKIDRLGIRRLPARRR